MKLFQLAFGTAMRQRKKATHNLAFGNKKSLTSFDTLAAVAAEAVVVACRKVELEDIGLASLAVETLIVVLGDEKLAAYFQKSNTNVR